MKAHMPLHTHAAAQAGAAADCVSGVSADVIVVGGGGAGLSAAIEAASLGREVILLEKNAHLGGSTTRSIGSFAATGTRHQLRKGIEDNPDDHFEDLGIINDQYCRSAFPAAQNEDNLELRRI